MKVVLEHITKRFIDRNKKNKTELVAVSDMCLPPENRGVGMVFQSYALYPHLTVRQNITFPLENLKGDKKLTKQEMNDRALGAAKLVQLDGYMERKPSELSGGQQQRVAIARAQIGRAHV